MKLTIGFPKYALKFWSELTDARDKERYNAHGVDQFEYYSSYILDATGKWVNNWSINDNFSYLTRQDIDAIANLQVADEVSVETKMNFLFSWGDSWGNPIRVPGNYSWREAPYAKMISSFYGGQIVEVLETKDMLVDYMGTKTTTTMCRVRSFSRADFAKTHENAPHLIHYMTGVSKTNQHRDRVKGLVRLPVALGSEFDFAGTFKPAQWWLMKRWLKYAQS